MATSTIKAGLRGLAGIAKMPSIFWNFSRLGFSRKAKNFGDGVLDFRDKTVAITGANSGIGRAVADAVARGGGRALLLCRNAERGQNAVDELRRRCKLGGSAELIIADIADLSSVRRAAAELGDYTIDALVHNAGALHSERQLTRDNLELDFALQLAGPHLLTHLLLEQILSADGRVVFVASGGMYSERLSMSDMDWSNRRYDGVRAYALVKRGQVALAQCWAEESDLDVRAMHPGWVDTPGVESSLPSFYRRLNRWLRSPAQGADTIVWLTGSKSVPGRSGDFYFDREPVNRYLLPGTRESAAERQALWQALEALL